VYPHAFATVALVLAQQLKLQQPAERLMHRAALLAERAQSCFSKWLRLWVIGEVPQQTRL
jgi:hypothetical protein